MQLPANLVESTFLRRDTRFSATVILGRRHALVHVANSGRMQELLQPGNLCYLVPRPGEGRKSRYDLLLVRVGTSTLRQAQGSGQSVLVSADARLPSALLVEAIMDGRLPQFAGYREVRQEVRYGDSRVDLFLQDDSGPCLVEAKSVTLIEDGVALFPDAPTARGRRHVLNLATAVRDGHRAAVIFVIQRPDAQHFQPNEEADAPFCAALRKAARAGVEVYAYRCRVSLKEIRLAEAIPVQL